jgi:hypothetical protein
MMWTVILLMSGEEATTVYVAHVVAPSPEEAAIAAHLEWGADELEVVDLLIFQGYQRDHSNPVIRAALRT